jgi:hypothetical protein
MYLGYMASAQEALSCSIRRVGVCSQLLSCVLPRLVSPDIPSITRHTRPGATQTTNIRIKLDVNTSAKLSKAAREMLHCKADSRKLAPFRRPSRKVIWVLRVAGARQLLHRNGP